MKYRSELVDMPNFKEALLTTLQCEKCHYKSSDILLTGQDKPMEYRLSISSADDLDTHVARSSSASIEIPELGVRIDPVSSGESFISNVEGVLKRVRSVLEQSERASDDAGTKAKARELLGKIELMMDGKFNATLIIRDPLGNSFIAGDKAERAEYEPDAEGN